MSKRYGVANELGMNRTALMWRSISFGIYFNDLATFALSINPGRKRKTFTKNALFAQTAKMSTRECKMVITVHCEIALGT